MIQWRLRKFVFAFGISGASISYYALDSKIPKRKPSSSNERSFAIRFANESWIVRTADPDQAR
eukprot:1201532-Amorphochlora_amoeboformis.AAC.1